MASCTAQIVVVAWMLLTLSCIAVQANDCNPGVLSAGWITPLGDLNIEEGQPAELFCYLNTSHPDGVGGSYKNLSFWVDNQLMEEPIVQKYNDSAIRIRIDKTVVSPKGFYVVTCRQNMSKGICTRYVYVGYKPGEVTDFQCTSYNWERLECTWTEPPNPISTTYALSYQALGRSRRTQTTRCPGMLSSSRRLMLLASRVSADDTSTNQSCVWTESTTPPYLATVKSFNFTMAAFNEVANMTQYVGEVNNFAIVVPNAMEALRSLPLTPNSANVTWKVPFNLALFPPGLEFRAAYQILTTWTDVTVLYDVEAAQQLDWDPKNLNYQLALTLPYANVDYNVTVWARSTVANKSDDRFWSPAASTIFRTLPDRPCSAPAALSNSFEVLNTRLEQRTVTLRWSQLSSDCLNGPQPGYEISMLDVQGNQLGSPKQVNNQTITSVSFDNLDREKAYKFLLVSNNNIGYSPNSTSVFMPMSSNMPTPPENVMRIAYNETFFEIQWTGSQASRGLSMATFGRSELNYPSSISHYTVFWCRSVRDSPVQCQGELYTQDVPAEELSLNVTVPVSGANYQFAVEANQGDYGSGMVWSTCIVIANGNGSQIKQVEVVSATTFSLDVAWKLPCSVQNGIIIGYNIYYCPVEDSGDLAAHEGEEPSCLSTHTPIRTPPNVEKYTLDGLEPYTLYKIVMSVETRLGEGQSSSPLLNRTGEGQPSMPLNLKPTEITNKTLSITWSAPVNPNGANTYYMIYRNNEAPNKSLASKMTMTDVESYTDYTLRVQACNSQSLCSEKSEEIQVKTLIGAPSQPGMPSMKSSSDNSSQIEIKWQPPVKPAGPIHLSSIVIQDRLGEDRQSYTIYGASTAFVVPYDEICQAGLELRFKVMTMNENEIGEFLTSPWSDEGTYTCKYEGFTLTQILCISFGVVLVVVVILAFFIGRRFQIKKKRAQTTEVKLPWDTTIGSELLPASAAGEIVKKLHQQGSSDLVISTGKTAGNFYGRLEPSKVQTDRIPRPPVVVDLKKQQSSNQQIELDYVSDRQSHTSSGNSSAGADSLSWQHSRSEISNSDSGAEMEPSTSSPDVFVKSPMEQFIKTTQFTSSHNLTAEMANRPDVDFNVQYSAVQLRNRNSAPDLTAAPYVFVGTAPQPVATGQNLGYVTLGQTQGLESNNPSPNASPNLSIGSNDSLIGKSERESSRPSVKIFPLKRNSGSSGYVQACLAESSMCNEPRVNTNNTSTGYVAFKCHEPSTASELNGTASPRSPVNPSPQPLATTAIGGGYVTLGANSAGGAASRAPTSAHYVQMGSQPNHSLSYV